MLIAGNVRYKKDKVIFYDFTTNTFYGSDYVVEGHDVGRVGTGGNLRSDDESRCKSFQIEITDEL